MATTIVTKNSSTASAVPTAAQLVQGELAVNVADKRIYTENNVGGIVELGTNPSAEIVANGGIALPDNGKATFGAGDDLQIYHDGSNSYVQDAGDGALILNTTNGGGVYVYSAGETMATFNSNGAVNLYYDNAAKLATTATGIDVTGTGSYSSGININSNGVGLLIGGGTTGSTAIGVVKNSAGRMTVDTDGTRSLDLSTGGTKRLSANGSTGDISFYEDTGTTPKFFWDASAEKLNLTGVGGLDVTGTATMDGLSVSDSQAGGVTAQIQNSNSTQTGGSRLDFLFSGSTVTGRIQNRFNGADFQTDWYTGNDGLEIFTDLAKTEKRLDIASNGDISFYEDTGTTAKLFWDASEETLTVGGDDSATSSGLKSLILGEYTGTGSGAVFRASSASAINFEDSNASTAGRLYYNHTSDYMSFNTAGTERMRIDSAGNLLLGTTSVAVASQTGTTQGIRLAGGADNIQVASNSTPAIFNKLGADGGLIQFNKSGTTVGSIGANAGRLIIGTGNTGIIFDSSNQSIIPRKTSDGTTTTVDLGDTDDRFRNLYLSGGVITSSDYRLKEDVQPMQSFADTVKAMNLVNFKWKNSDKREDGFIAHELQELVPNAVKGNKDEVNENGDNQYQGIDPLKLIPVLTKALQEALVRIEILESNLEV